LLNDYGRDHARGAELESPYGRIVSSWKREGGQILWQFTISANTTAELRLRAADGKAPADG
jgi:alpha-L-rhamnosidase